MLFRSTSNQRLAIFVLCVTSLVATAPVLRSGSPVGTAYAAPLSATDSTKVPHYFGPYPNWANSPQAVPNAVVTISGDGTGAEATATVNPRTGGISAISVTNPGSGYTHASVSVESPGLSFTAAVAVPTLSVGAVTSVSVIEPGFGFVSPRATLVDHNPDRKSTRLNSSHT